MRFIVVALGVATAACAASRPDPTPAPRPNVERAPLGHGTPIVYAPAGPLAYVLHRKDDFAVRLPNGQTQNQAFTQAAYLTVATAAGTPMRVTVTLDSLSAEGPINTAAAADSARGTRWTGDLAPTGQLSNLTASRLTSFGEQLRGMIPVLFPALPAGGVRDRSEWTDSAQTTLRAMAFNVKEHSVSSSHAAADTARTAGRPWIRIETDAPFSRSGGGSQFGQAVEVQASGTRHLTSRIRPDGVLASTEGTESSDMTLTIPAIGQSLPVKQSATFSVTLVRGPR